MTGFSFRDGPYRGAVYIHAQNVINPLATPKGWNSAVNGLTDGRAAVGFVASGSSRRGALWTDPNTIVYPDTVTDPAHRVGSYLEAILGINNNMRMFGVAADANGTRHNVRIDPLTLKAECVKTINYDSKGNLKEVWCDGRACPQGNCHLFSANPKDPKEPEKDEGQHGKDNPLPYTPGRAYICRCQ